MTPDTFRGAAEYLPPPVSALSFICPTCGHRSSRRDRIQGLRGRDLTCEKCGGPFLFELLDDYYPAPNVAMFVADQEGRVLGCGKGSFELTGLRDDRALGRDLREVLGLVFDDGADEVGTVIEWGVRKLGRPASIEADGDLPARVIADIFPAYDDDGGVLLVLTPEK